MLVVGLALNGYILYSVFYVESVNKKPEVKLLTDADELKTQGDGARRGLRDGQPRRATA
jgi:hypothetical protein